MNDLSKYFTLIGRRETALPKPETESSFFSNTGSESETNENSYLNPSYALLWEDLIKNANPAVDTEYSLDLDKLNKYLTPSTVDRVDDDSIDDIPEKRAPNTMNHFLRDRKAQMGRFLRDRKALGHFLRDRKDLGHFLRDRKASGNHLSHFLRDRKASINHFLRDRKMAWRPIRDLEVIRQLFATKSKRELHHLLRDRRSKNIREKVENLTRF